MRSVSHLGTHSIDLIYLTTKLRSCTNDLSRYLAIGNNAKKLNR